MLSPQFETFKESIPKVRAREVELYEKHFELLKSWNEKIGLVSRKSIDKSFGSHYVDSIYIAEFADRYRKEMPVYDLGSGAGFPGIIYAIRYPEAKVTLYERMLKKQGFLSAALAGLSLDNLQCGGEFPPERRSGLFIARAVLPPAELFAFMEKRMKEGSVLILNVGGSSDEVHHPRTFSRLGQLTYTLPMDCGSRRVESFLYVPRGTN